LRNQVDLYTNIHKGQRFRFFMISKIIGSMNASDQNALTALENELISFQEHMYLHAGHEENVIHPLLSERVPGGANRLNEDHRIMHRQFDELDRCFGEIKEKPTDFEKREEQCLEFYLAWNRFLSFYFDHINYEEEYVMPTLWKLCASDELVDTFRKVLADQTPKELMDSYGMMLPATSPTERVMILKRGQAVMPPEVFQGTLKVAEQVLTLDDWVSIKKMLKLEV
jgi:hypothetical protein